MKNIIKSAIAVLIASLMLLASAGASFAQDSSQAENWVSAWSTSPINASLSGLGKLDDVGISLPFITSRVCIEPTLSGSALRLVFSNEFSNGALKIGACTVANAQSDNLSIDKASLVEVTVNSNKRFSVEKGKRIVSDPIKINIEAGKKIIVSTYYEGINTFKTIGLIGGKSYASFGNTTKAETVRGIKLEFDTDSGDYEVIPSLVEMDVLANEGASACVMFGDSTIASEVPRYLAANLRSNGINNVSVTQAAIRGNRLLENGVGVFAKLLGEATPERFERDVLSQAGVKYVIIKIGANDVVHPHCETKKDKLKPATLEEMASEYNEIIDLCHKNGIKVYICEIASWKGYTRDFLNMNVDVVWNLEIDKLRLDTNEWMHSVDCKADAVISSSMLSDPNDQYALLPAYTTDGIHHTVEGTKFLATTFSPDLFR